MIGLLIDAIVKLKKVKEVKLSIRKVSVLIGSLFIVNLSTILETVYGLEYINGNIQNKMSYFNTNIVLTWFNVIFQFIALVALILILTNVADI